MTAEMVGEPTTIDKQRDQALRELATAVETRELISKKTFQLRYKLVYGGSQKEAEELF